MIREALSFIDPTDRDTWVRAGMAIKSELGEEGFDIWDAWSRQADSYKESSARSVWRSCKRGGGITIGTLYAEAKRNGWTAGSAVQPAPKVDHARRAAEQRELDARHAEAARKAQLMILQAETGEHPYLARKGFPRELGLIWKGLLLVPMRDIHGYALNSVQSIDADGRKKFLFGGKAKGSVFIIGKGADAFLCEGYATGLSIAAALQSLYRTARVVVCFSAANMAYIAERIRGFVVADHDESGTGEKYALKTRLPWWMPPEIGDANDFHMARGIRPLAEALNGLRRAGQGRGAVASQYVSSDSGLSVRSCTVGESRESV